MANRQYNPNTKYGRKKSRDQAKYNYDNGTPEYRKEIDTIGNYVWLVFIGIFILIGGCIYTIGGADALKSWLK